MSLNMNASSNASMQCSGGMQCGVPMAVSKYENFPVKHSVWYGNKGGLNVIVPEFGQGILLSCDTLSQIAKVLLHDGSAIEVHASQVTMHVQHKIPATYEEFLEMQKLKHGQDVYENPSVNPLKRGRDDCTRRAAGDSLSGVSEYDIDRLQRVRSRNADFNGGCWNAEPVSGNSATC